VKSEPGTYALILHSTLSGEVQIGRWGSLRVEPWYYLYVGSAFGPGGVRARVARHFRKAKRNHWHIDYLREAIEPVCAWCSYVPFRLEHEWAQAFGRMEGVSCIKGFGCSDCSCNGHLFAMDTNPVGAEVLRTIGESFESWPDRTTV
jgi:Uri superfamily endonuclease